MDSDAPPASLYHPVAPSSQGLFQSPPPYGLPGRTAASWTTNASSRLPVAPSSQVFSPMPPPPGHPGRTAVPSSQVFSPMPPPPGHPGRTTVPSLQLLFQPPPPPGHPGHTAASWAAKASQGPGRTTAQWIQLSPGRPFVPSFQGPGRATAGPGRTTGGGQDKSFSYRPVPPSSQDPFPPLLLHGQPGRASWTPPGQPGNAASKASSYPNWVMLDPHIRLNYHPKEDLLCAHAVAETSMGEHIDVSFRTVTPPGASRLYVRWTPHGRTKGESSSGAGRGEDCSDRFNGRDPIIVAAHGSSILLQLTFENTQSDFFVYTLPSSGPPSLKLLPSCNHKFTCAPCSAGWVDHMSRIKEIGLLCNAEEEKFVVVDLTILPSAYKDDDAPVVAELCVLQGSGSKDGWTTTPWRAIRPQIHIDKEQGKGMVWWETDRVVPFCDFLCYVDYFRGIFFVNVLSMNPVLHYVCLPVTIPNGDPVDPETGLRGCPEHFRSVCVTNDGCILKFVEVVTSTVFVSGSHAPASSSFAINVWKLMQDSMRWEKEYVMDDTALWSLQGCGDLLRVAPSFPLVSMEEPDVVYFVLSNRCFNDADASWVIVVDMLKKTKRSLSRYNKVYPGCIGSDDDMASASLATNSAFIPCAFSKYLRMRACV